jgi:hypothetical protein
MKKAVLYALLSKQPSTNMTNALILGAAGKVTLIVKYVYLPSPFFNVANYNYNHLSNISIVFHKYY